MKDRGRRGRLNHPSLSKAEHRMTVKGVDENQPGWSGSATNQKCQGPMCLNMSPSET